MRGRRLTARRGPSFNGGDRSRLNRSTRTNVNASVSSSNLVRRRARVRGVVQGVGFRPFTQVLATRLGLTGRVGNDGGGVWLAVQGTREAVAEFFRLLEREAPSLARIDAIDWDEGPPIAQEAAFEIAPSLRPKDDAASVPPDVAPCAACLAEVADPRDRRFGYPFANCAQCGPRYTIINATPYDRPHTTMAGFAMCAACEREYEDPADRRFHAQPIACPDCGPTARWDATGDTGEAALGRFDQAIASGLIAAVKGVGGFHLACDATNQEAVARLRARKGRDAKPFAILAASLDQAERYVEIGPDEARLLTRPDRPIVLARKRAVPRGPSLAHAIAPGLAWLGVMLPASPLHGRIAPRDRPIVMTSGNLSDEPIAHDNNEARSRLGAVADGFLTHDRPIAAVCDDSVTRWVEGVGEVPIRRARGRAPLPLPFPFPEAPSVLAVGGELKATFCLTRDDRAWVSPHVGDMGNLETLVAFERAVAHIERLFRTRPVLIAADMHPGYLSGQWAERFAQERGCPLARVPHHHAHAASCLVENGWPDDGREALAVVLDGTGLGPDGTIWGGEFLRVSYRSCERVGHLAPIRLPGGDAAVQHPRRAALAHLFAAGIPWDDDLPCVAACSASERHVLWRQLETGQGCVTTTSAGRLCDAASSLLDVRQSVHYEAQAALELESLAWEGRDIDSWECPSEDPPAMVADPSPLWRALIAGMRQGRDRAALAAWFHKAVADLVVAWCRRARVLFDLHDVVLSGGVFQNALLLRNVVEGLRREGLRPMFHRSLPPNDGGLALGQAAITAARSGP